MVSGISGWREIRAIGAVNGSEQGIRAAGLLKDVANACNTKTETIAGKMAGGAGAAIGAEALEEGILFIDGAGGIVGGNEAGRVAERKEVGNDDGGGDRGQREPGEKQGQAIAARCEGAAGTGIEGHRGAENCLPNKFPAHGDLLFRLGPPEWDRVCTQSGKRAGGVKR